MALPLLDAMRVRGRAAGDPAKSVKRRMVCINTPLGLHPANFFPEQTGRDYALSPYLQVLESLRSELTVFSNVSHPGVDGGHSNEVSFLTGAPHPAGAGFRNSVSLDQLAAEQLGNQTRFSSLVVGVANGGDRSMSFNRSGVLIPPETSPAALYKKLFVQGTAKEIEARVNDLKAGRSLLDTVRERSRQLEKSAAIADRHRLEQYFSSIRELEQQLLQAEAWEQKPKPQVTVPAPQEMKDPSQLISRLRATLDVTRLALETDSTRIVSIFVQPLGVLSEIPQVSRETHSLTHHGNRPEMIEELQKIEIAQFQALRDFLTGLQNVTEGPSTLLDRSAVLYGTCMGNANGHTNKDWPLLLAGGGFKHGQHIRFSKDKNEPLAKLFVSLLQRMGLQTDQFAAVSGTMPGLEMTRS